MKTKEQKRNEAIQRRLLSLNRMINHYGDRINRAHLKAAISLLEFTIGRNALPSDLQFDYSNAVAAANRILHNEQ